MVDGQVAQQGWARPGDVWHFQGNSSVGIRASNAAALVLIVNNQPQGVLGTRGQLFDQTFTLGGAATPTVGPTSTATTTLLPTWTLTATASRTPTSTASASAASPDQATLLFTGIPPGAETATSAPAIQIPPTETLTQTASATSTLTPSPTATLSPTSTLTPSATPFLPPRLTRTPSPAPK
jgi:hypothetical protein